jgi:hypothetical protein
MERVSRFLEAAHEPRSQTQIESGVKGNAKFLRTAIDVRRAEGYVDEFGGARKARMVRLVRVYRAEEEVERLAELMRADEEADT